jgi:hypothetical protein
VLLVGFFGEKGNRPLTRTLNEIMESTGVLFTVARFLILQPLPKQLSNSGSNERVGNKSAFDSLYRESSKRFS